MYSSYRDFLRNRAILKTYLEAGGIAATDYLRDVGLHRQLTIKMDPEITNGLQRTDHRGASIQR